MFPGHWIATLMICSLQPYLAWRSLKRELSGSACWKKFRMKKAPEGAFSSCRLTRLVMLSFRSDKHQKGNFLVLRKIMNFLHMSQQYFLNFPGRTVSPSNPDNLGRATEQKTAFMKIGILRANDAVVDPGIIPDFTVRRKIESNGLNMERSGINRGQTLYEPWRKILIEQ